MESLDIGISPQKAKSFGPLVVDNKHLVIKPSTLGRDAGNGLFVTINIPRNAIVTEYTGSIISLEEADNLRKMDMALARQGKTPRYAAHVASLGRHQKIKGLRDPQAAFGRGGASFANDPRSPAMYNTKLVGIFDKKLGREKLWLKATRDILVRDPSEGEELFLNYQGTFWGMESGDIQEKGTIGEVNDFPEIDECEDYDVSVRRSKK